MGVLREQERATVCLAAGRLQFVESVCILHVLEGTDDKHVKFFRYLQEGLDVQFERANSHIDLTKEVFIFRYFSKSDKVFCL